MGDTLPTCCFIDREGDDCGRVAEWGIYHGSEPHEYTESCTGHVGDLLTDAPEHKVYPLLEDPTA